MNASRAFLRAQAAYNGVNASSLSGSDPELQTKVAEGLGFADAAIQQVEKADIFSENELLQDMNTCDLKFLVLPFYRGELLQRLNEHEPRRRIDLLDAALASLKGFLAGLSRLEALTPEVRAGWQLASSGEAADAATTRTQKIARVKAQKAAQAQLKLIGEKLEKADAADDDAEHAEELQREHMLLLLETCALTALDSIRGLTQELDMLRQIAAMRRPDGSLPFTPGAAVEEEGDSRSRFHMITVPPGGGPQSGAGPSGAGGSGVVRELPMPSVGTSAEMLSNRLMDASSRLSYQTAMRQIHTGEIPGLYSYSVEEGLRQEEAERALEAAQKQEESSRRAEAKEKQRKDAEEKGGEENAEELRRLRLKDDWKDTHTRGYGNRKNRS